MTTLIVHGYVQMWNRQTGMSRSKAAFIETVQGKKKFKMVLYFSTGEVTAFQLSDNIKSVTFRSYGENENHLHLTFQNSDFLFIEGLSSSDARDLKIFLDRIHQDGHQSPMRFDQGDGVFTRTTTQGINKASSHKVYKKSSSECSESDKKRRTSYFEKMSLFKEKSSTFIYKELENQLGKRKRMLASGLEMRNENEKFLKESNFKRSTNKINLLKYTILIWEKQLKSRQLKGKKKLAVGSSFMTNFFGNPYLDVAIPHTITEKVFLPFFWDPNYTEYDSDWNVCEMSVKFYPEKIWQGLPNLGNTCYMNAVLQSLCSIPSFVNDLLNQGFPWGKIPRDAFSLCLSQLLVLKDIYNIKTKQKLLVSVKKSISVLAEVFSGDMQNDAHEFLSLSLDQLKETMKRLSMVWKVKNGSGEDSPQVLSGNFATKMIICPVITNFEFELLCSIFCKSCGHAVLKTEPSNYLSVNLPQGPKAHPLSIQSTFDLFFDAEELEYKCEKCSHNRSVAIHKFSRLPRVLIVHLKRYSFNEFWSLRKDEQEVIIPKYLKVSSHCNENTKPPLLLSKNAHIKDFHLLKIFQRMSFGILKLSTLSAKSSKSKMGIGSDKKSVPQKFQKFLKGTRREQKQKYVVKNSKASTIESESESSGDKALSEEEMLADSILSLICGDDCIPSPDISLIEEAYLQVPEIVKLKKHEKADGFVESDFDSVTGATEDLCEDKNTRIPGRFQNGARQTQQCDSMRIHEETLQQAFPNAQRPTQNLITPTELNVEKANMNSSCLLDTSKDPKDKDTLDKTESEVKEPKKSNADKKDPHTYRLIGVISHIGNTTHSGHYISDAYDFKRQLWFTYNDLQISSIQEEQVQNGRLCTGYIFFYMHNEIFEELLIRGERVKSCSTQAKKTSEEEK